MDLRIKRTKAMIKEAYLKLCAKKTIEKITVTELCRKADINKSTFYLHYSDIYALADEAEDEIIEDILSGLNITEKVFKNSYSFADMVINAFLERKNDLKIVFSGSRRVQLVDKIEKRIKSLLYANYPNINNKKTDITLTFLIQGLFHTLTAPYKTDNEQYNELMRLVSIIMGQIYGDNAESM